MAEIHTIQPGQLAPREPNQDVIARLRNLLELAESGELRAIAYVAFRDDDAINTSWSSGVNNWKIVAGVTKLWARVMKDEEERSL